MSASRHEIRAWLVKPSKRPIVWSLLDPVAATSDVNGTMTKFDDRSILVTGDRPEVDSYEIAYKTGARQVTGF